MTLPASPPIDLNQICTEFGAPIGTPLGSFLRGGAWVPDTPANASAPTALPISMLSLLGAVKTLPSSVYLGEHYIEAFRDFKGAAVALYRFVSTGTTEEQVNNKAATPFSGEWLLSGSAADFEVMVLRGGTNTPALSGIVESVWQPANTTWTASLATAVAAIKTGEVLVSLRPAGGGATVASATVYLYAEFY